MDDILKKLSKDMQERGLTDDAFLGGKLNILQPLKGYRAAMDPVLMAAAAPRLRNGHVLDLGAGVGTAGFCYLNRCPDVKVTGLELQEDLSKLSIENATRNDFAEQYTAVQGDLSDKAIKEVASNFFDMVITNPPYVDARKATNSPDVVRQKANIETDVSLSLWLDFTLKKLKQKGWLVLIQRADRIDDILVSLHGKLGEVSIIPLWPKQGEPAKRVIIRGRKSVKGAAIMHPGLCLHEDGRRYTKEAEAILRDGQPLD